MRIIATSDFVWRGLDLHLGQRTKPLLALLPDPSYPHLFRIRYPNGWTSSPAGRSDRFPKKGGKALLNGFRDRALGQEAKLQIRRLRAPET